MWEDVSTRLVVVGVGLCAGGGRLLGLNIRIGNFNHFSFFFFFLKKKPPVIFFVSISLFSPARTEAAAGEGARRIPCRGSAGGLRAGRERRRRGGLGEKGTGFGMWDKVVSRFFFIKKVGKQVAS